MPSKKSRPTVDEIFALLKRTNLPTVLVEGKDDIVFYRRIEEDLSDLSIDVLPAGNKQSVLELMGRLEGATIAAPIVYVVDKDLWVHNSPEDISSKKWLVTTEGYSIENDLFSDGELEILLSKSEFESFKTEVTRFLTWYALAVDRALSDRPSAFRTHPGKVLDDVGFYEEETRLCEGEKYPDDLKKEIQDNYQLLLRGKSLIAILHRQLSKDGRHVKYSGKQLMEFGGARKGKRFERLKTLIADAISS